LVNRLRALVSERPVSFGTMQWTTGFGLPGAVGFGPGAGAATSGSVVNVTSAPLDPPSIPVASRRAW